MKTSYQPTNVDLIEMHLLDFLHESGQYGNVTWSAIAGYCVGYYGAVTGDHVEAIMRLEFSGALLSYDFSPRR